MLYSEHMLSDAFTRLKTIDKKLKNETTIDEITRSNIFGACFDLILAFEESYFAFKNYDYKENIQAINRSIPIINDATTGEEVKHEIQKIISIMPEDHNYNYLSVSDFNRTSYNAVTRIEPIGAHNLRRISAAIQCNDREVNILDPKCNTGVNLGTFKRAIRGSVAYGIEKESHIADEAKKVLDRVAKGNLMGSRISNEVFDMMFVDMPISWSMNDNTLKFVKQERKYFQDTIKYLRDGGVGIYIMPFFRLYKDMCTYFAKSFTDIQLVKLSGTDFIDKGLIAIVGKKKSGKELDDEAYKMLRRARDINKFDDIMESDFKNYTLPNTALEVEIFRGSVLDFDEMETIVSGSGCMEDFWNNQQVEKLSENAKRPLLPFNVGQIGLVLTSGCLDGIVDEGNGHYHVIKGRVSKKHEIERNIVNGEVEVHETVSNRVEINVILPNGEYKVLA